MQAPIYAIVISTEAAFNFLSVVRSHGWLQLPPFTWRAEDELLEYIHQNRQGLVTRMWLFAHKYGVAVGQPDAQTIHDIQPKMNDAARRMLGSERDLRPFYAGMRAHADYDWLETEGHGRILTCPSAWEDLAKILLTTNCTWAQTVQMCRRLCQLGAPHPTIKGLHAFPTAERIAAMPFDELAEALRAGYRNAYLHELAQKIAHGEIEPESWKWLDADALYKAVKALKGFGDYAAATYARMNGHYDRLAIDSAARSLYASQHKDGEKASDQEIREHYDRYGEWQGLVLWLDIMRHNYDA